MLNVGARIKALQDVNYLVVGLGLSGYSAASFLIANGYRCRIQDTRDIPPYLGKMKAKFGGAEFFAGELRADLIDWADVIVVSPGLSARSDELRRAAGQGKEIVGDVELFARIVDKPVVAITGSNGKSTVTTLVGEMIRRDGKKAGVGGNLGTAALDLLAADADADFFVLELSSYQLETTDSLRPCVAALLNLCEDHLDRYDSYQAYIDAKRRIYRNAEICVSNLDDALTRNDADDLCFSLSADPRADFRLLRQHGDWLARREQPWLRVDELKVSGRHNWANCLAAMAIAHSLGISRDAILEALRAFPGIPHRSQPVAEIDGVEWVNDSKATNVGAASASIEGRDRPVILIAGGQSKGADTSLMAPLLCRKVRLALLLGEDAGLLEDAWRDAVPLERVADMRAAVRRAREVAQAGDCVLLAPACASFDMYRNFEERGDDFMRLVAELQDD